MPRYRPAGAAANLLWQAFTDMTPCPGLGCPPQPLPTTRPARPCTTPAGWPHKGHPPCSPETEPFGTADSAAVASPSAQPPRFREQTRPPADGACRAPTASAMPSRMWSPAAGSSRQANSVFACQAWPCAGPQTRHAATACVCFMLHRKPSVRGSTCCMYAPTWASSVAHLGILDPLPTVSPQTEGGHRFGCKLTTMHSSRACFAPCSTVTGRRLRSTCNASTRAGKLEGRRAGRQTGRQVSQQACMVGWPGPQREAGTPRFPVCVQAWVCGPF